MVRSKIDDDVDALFKLPIAEFIGARKILATRLKKEGRADEAEQIQALAKPSISAWTVNQLHWNYRDEFEELIAAGERFRKAQTSRSAGKVADMRDALDARREALSQLSDLATTLLHDAGHNPTLDMIRRITTTLEAVSAYELLPDGLSPGRLTKDVDPPGFETLASFIPGAGTSKRTETSRVSPLKKAGSGATKTRVTPVGEGRRVEETRQTKIAAAKVSLQDAKKALADARSKAERLAATQEKADAEVKEAEKQRREAEVRLKKAVGASEAAARRARTVMLEVEEATKKVEDAKRVVEKATRELESLFRQPPGK